jgi:hypothetical protein
VRVPRVASCWTERSEWLVLTAVFLTRDKLSASRLPVCRFPLNSSALVSGCNASSAGLSSALRLGSVIVIFMLMLGPVLMRMLVLTCESADGGSARPSDESARQNRAPTEYANGRPSSRPDSTTCNSSFFAVRQ